MPNSKIRELESVVTKLEGERQGHLQAIAEIEEAFSRMGIASTAGGGRRRKPGPKPGSRRGRKPGPKPGKRRGRPAGAKSYGKPGPRPKARRGKGPTGNRYAVSGTSLITQMVRGAGAKGISGGAINKVWKKQGRAGTAYNVLGQLTKDGSVKKQKNRGGRGSLYILG
jgi:hypothetical protein